LFDVFGETFLVFYAFRVGNLVLLDMDLASLAMHNLTLFYIEMQRCDGIGEREIDVLRRSSLASIFSPTLLSS